MLRGSRQQVNAQIGRTDIVRFLDDQVPPALKARRSTGKRERDQQSQQAKYGPFHNAQTLPRSFRVLGQSSDGDAVPGFKEQEHAEKQPSSEH